MLSAKELRIGNYVNDICGNPYKIVATSFENVWNNSLTVFAIPLTPELLERCGFKSEPNKYAKCGFIFSMEHRHDFKIGHFIESVKFTSGTETHVEIVGLNWVKCQYLHQLQNLFFALTGTELTITF